MGSGQGGAPQVSTSWILYLEHVSRFLPYAFSDGISSPRVSVTGH